MLVKRIAENASYLVLSELVHEDTTDIHFGCLLKECSASKDVRPYILFEKKDCGKFQ